MTFIRLSQYLTVFLIALAISYLVTPIIAKVARILKILDNSTEDKLHKKPTPRLGGLAIFIAYFSSLLITGNLDSSAGIIITGGTAILILGILDDVFRVSAVIKLAFIAVLTYILAGQGLIIDQFKEIFFVRYFITLLWIVGVTSAFNAVDNMDGLASGLGAIASITFLIIAVRTSQWGWAALTVALCGALLGFLRYNFNDAKIFMGDSGSLFLGFTLASLGIKGEWSTNPIKALIIPVLVLGVPIFDLGYIVIRRWIEGTAKGIIKAITFCAKDHLSHRLVDLGLKQNISVLFIYLIAVCVSIGAVVLQNTAGWDAILLFLQFVLIFIIVLLLISITGKARA